MSSETAFTALVTELKLDSLVPKMKEMGWVTFGDFAFATGDTTGKDAEAFDKEVVKVLLKEDGTQKHLTPRLRRLYAQAYIVASQAMNDFANPQGVNEKAHMLPADRAARTAAVRSKITGFEVKGVNLPSTALTDKCVTILNKGVVKYVPWEKCTSKDQELLEQPEVRGLRITPEGLLLQDVTPDPNTNISGEFLWDYAVRRRALAADVAGLCEFATMDLWHEALKGYFLMTPPPPGYRAVSWAQLQNADVALWQAVGRECEDGCKASHEDPSGKTAFDIAFKKLMFDPDVRACLQFLQSSPSSSSPSASSDNLNRLQNRINNLEQALAGQKRKHHEQPYNDKGKGKGKKGDKGKGKKGSARRGAGTGVPAAFNGLPGKTPSGENYCFNFNLPVGCHMARPGEKCHRGHHVCPRCNTAHSLQACTAR